MPDKSKFEADESFICLCIHGTWWFGSSHQKSNTLLSLLRKSLQTNCQRRGHVDIVSLATAFCRRKIRLAATCDLAVGGGPAILLSFHVVQESFRV